jgi:hypothetical protein
MGRLAVRTAVANALTAADITYVGTVYPARPVILEEQDYVQTMSGEAIALSPDGSSAVLVVNLPGMDKRERRAFVGRPAVNDTNIIPVAVEIFFASTPGYALTQAAGISAQEDYDAIVDALVVYIRHNPVMSAPTVVWSAGEYTAGVTHAQEQPYTSTDGLTVLINGTVRFEAWQWISGLTG